MVSEALACAYIAEKLAFTTNCPNDVNIDNEKILPF